ncbi:nucleoside triphosphate pyrophosphohydrolase family protein [Krasilnikovia sp. MM14-A1259]|uniref:nucleoside triphosphate pyrophosphohydrolase family protein n=1 Tax=Krasilnikovia sp. MM14-A1259 TaxID=3373539 RepID=UPI00380BC906
MEMAAYQNAAAKTIQPVRGEGDSLVVPLLGLAGEAGAVLNAYKKRLRDGPADPQFRARMREKLGDVLWYLSTVARRLDLDLDDIATANLSKITDRWRPTPAAAIPFDADLEPAEQLPRQADFTFTLTPKDGRDVSVLSCAGEQVGDPITDASHIADGYCFHDAFHLSYAAVLGWSPVMRALLKRKRRSNPETDEAEDGGRAVVIEEGISALVFGYASRHNYLEGKNHVDNDVLNTITGMVAHLEVAAHRAADWEKAILTGFAAWRELRRRGGGTVRLDLDAQTLVVLDAEGCGEAPAPASAAAVSDFRAAAAALHRSKNAAYGDSWKRRGEQISILANIARKVDRLSLVAANGTETADENTVDTVIDLFIYALKYLTFLADQDPAAVPDLPGRPEEAGGWSDGPDGLERLLTALDLSALDRTTSASLAADIDHTFAELEACFPVTGSTAPATTRARLATELADHALQALAVLRETHSDLYEMFVRSWTD